MEKLIKIFKSRTFWTIVVLFIINGVSAIQGYVPENWLPAVNGVLGILTLYFKANPSQEY